MTTSTLLFSSQWAQKTTGMKSRRLLCATLARQSGRGQPILDGTEVVDETASQLEIQHDAPLETFPPSVVTLPGLVSLILAQGNR
jgi:hypothetical protein